MLLQTIKPQLRQLTKRDAIKWMNILGLAIGIASAIFITTYIFFELQVGKTQANYKELFLLKSKDGAWHSAKTIETIKENVPEIEKTTAFHGQWGEAYIKKDGYVLNAQDILIGEPSFFSVFQYSSIEGNLEQALDVPNGFVITQKLATKIFGDNNPIGKTVTFQSEYFGNVNLVVSAVVKNIPPNALIQFSGIFNKQALNNLDWYKSGLSHWGEQNYFVFSKLSEYANSSEVANKVTKTIQANAPDWISQDAKNYSFVNITELHYDDTQFEGLFKKNKKSRLLTLGVIGLFLLIISWINFVNLATAQQDRLNHLASIKRSLGASKLNIILDSILDLIPTLSIALIFAVFLVVGMYQPFNLLTDTNTVLSNYFTSRIIFFIFLYIVSTMFVCGLLPFWLLKKKIGLSNRLRRTLSTFQFTISIGLIIATIAIVKQNEFVNTKETGYQSENILSVHLKGEAQNNSELFGDKIKNYSSVLDVAYSSQLINNVELEYGMSLSNEGVTNRIIYSVLRVSKNLFSFFNIPLVEGSGFNTASLKERHHIFNETALKTFGVDDITKAKITSYDNASGEIVGKVKDFNFRTFHYPVTALGFMEGKLENMNYLYVKLNSNAPNVISQCISSIEKDWTVIEPDWPVEVNFLSQSTKQLYEADQRFSKLILIVAFISILVSCIGLLGVSKFIAEQRTKEIGIRKVYGAKVSEILAMLNKDVIKWVAIAFMIACPIAYYAISKWIENFAYRTTLNWWIFALAGVLALGIALLTVSWQSWRVATRNPVEALRYE